MDLISFVLFCFNTRFILRWIIPGLVLFIPVVNFFSLGYLAKVSDLVMVGGMGMPTWEQKGGVFKEGLRFAYIGVLYEALPSFLFSFTFLLSSFDNPVTNFIAVVMKILAVLAFLFCSFFVPFAFCAYIRTKELRGAFDFERIAGAIKEVFAPYLLGYLASGVGIFLAYKLHSIPYLLGFALSSTLDYFVLLVSTYYFTQLFVRTRLA